MNIRVLSPTRVDLAGGTLDLWPLHAFIPNSKTINATISVFTGCELQTLNENVIQIEISNYNYKKTFKSFRSFQLCKDKALDILKPVMEFFEVHGSIQVKLFSESPVGGGLGGSSSLMVSMIKAFSALKNKNYNNYELIELAHNLEAKILNTPTGIQDYVAPLFGGVSLMNHKYDGLEVQSFDVNLDKLNENIIIVYTGKPHHSGLNNWSVFQKAVVKNKKCIAALQGIQKVTERLENQLNKNDMNLKSVFKEEFKHRVALSPSFSSPEIRKLEKLVCQNGAEAIKICGAGGGGCVVVLCKPNQKNRVRDLCLKKGFQVMDAKIIEQSVQVSLS